MHNLSSFERARLLTSWLREWDFERNAQRVCWNSKSIWWVSWPRRNAASYQPRNLNSSQLFEIKAWKKSRLNRTLRYQHSALPVEDCATVHTTAMIIDAFICFFTVKKYNLSYIHLYHEYYLLSKKLIDEYIPEVSLRGQGQCKGPVWIFSEFFHHHKQSTNTFVSNKKKHLSSTCSDSQRTVLQGNPTSQRLSHVLLLSHPRIEQWY